MNDLDPEIAADLFAFLNWVRLIHTFYSLFSLIFEWISMAMVGEWKGWFDVGDWK